ncbi:MAG TPA: lactate racemase domain-containing protein [Anaerolineae bacterium]
MIPSPTLADPAAATRSALAALPAAKHILPGMRVAVGAGSRGIADYDVIVRTVCEELKRLGAEVFIVPAMGSHGGATAEGQVGVLASLGIDEASTGAPILASMETVQLGETAEGIPVLLDKIAADSDGIVVVNRIKPHTEFTGPVQSGLLKMLVIGAGKHQGALAAHRYSVTRRWRNAGPAVARELIRKAPLLCGLGILENAYDETAEVVAVWPEDFEAVEAGLLQRACELLPRLPFDQLDILIVDESGKEMSGSGMDTNIIGRRMIVGEPEPDTPKITRIVLRSLSEHTYGNAIGVGLADFVTRRVSDRIDLRPTYINCLTAMTPEKARLPMTGENDREAIEWAFLTMGPVAPEWARVVRIQNTLHPDLFYASEALWPEIQANPRLRICGEPEALRYDDGGWLAPDKMPQM